MKPIRLSDVVTNCLSRAHRAGKKPVRLLLGPEIWPAIEQFHNLPHIKEDKAMQDGPPIYRKLPCYKMHAPGIAVVSV